MNKKFLKIIIISLILIIIVFVYIYIKDKKQIQNIKTEQTQDTVNRPVFNTSTSTNVVNTPETNTPEKTQNKEYVIYKEIKQNLFNWNITKDEEFIIRSVELSKNADNEAVFESWRDFISKNSKVLTDLTTKVDNQKDYKKTIHSLLEWYINLSGEYEKQTAVKKQEIINQYKLSE